MTTTTRDLVTTAVTRFTSGDLGGFLELLHEDFRSHNPGVAGPGRAAFAAYLHSAQWLHTSTVSVRHLLVDGDYAAVHTHIDTGSGPGIAAVDLFRAKAGRIAEHWDVVQQIPEQTPNPHPFF
ncbi:nuclear transport factor 2 family protein [Nocardia bovistercoris]|uniref:Nuclear transport factor 2 family protein n=1 Tax=Nocardia bovistercoris TaxID=2785916 RepID=A0A931IG01_9NOCA|nr:nuclear transport factor 2 family protein [Nocardia bovistercoris]MBH0780849.1 nuclear transport factor 2 family protein [Nocardia bovistercoris]